MSENNGTSGHQVGGLGGNLLERPKIKAAELNLIQRATRSKWNVSQQVKAKILERCELIVDAEDDDDLFLKAAKIVLEADKVDIAGERNQIEEKHNEVLQATEVLRLAMKTASMRETMAKVSDGICGLPEPLTPIHDDEPSEESNGQHIDGDDKLG